MELSSTFGLGHEETNGDGCPWGISEWEGGTMSHEWDYFLSPFVQETTVGAKHSSSPPSWNRERPAEGHSIHTPSHLSPLWDALSSAPLPLVLCCRSAPAAPDCHHVNLALAQAPCWVHEAPLAFLPRPMACPGTECLWGSCAPGQRQSLLNTLDLGSAGERSCIPVPL